MSYPIFRAANYDVWVRGYGLVDSPKVQTAPGKILNLTAVEAPNPQRGGRILPGRVLALPDPGAGPGTSSRARVPRVMESRRT